MVALPAAPAALKIKETKQVSAKDPELQAVKKCLVKANEIVALNQSQDDDEYVHIDGIACCTSCLEDQRK